jgi:hypothetical protein
MSGWRREKVGANRCLEPITAQQRRCACCWVPLSLRSSAAAQARRYTELSGLENGSPDHS